ncbi:tRNA uridine(34) 5-carboxymethylaminomethyl modification radical SAM/GNAT enzyme Elp3 [Candidatus Pacearchaeota archaeon]|nr:tRNA uridine(34) 5-carboxymethylaminomethyl modification radical SAM/GNAT enzyme Elp3 [Candidatus Pacearchaeota archaeon]
MNQLVKKPVRTISGVTPLTVVLKPRKCDHGTCIYCPGGDSVPQSYTNKSPAIMRALALSFDPYQQVMNRLDVLKKMGHPTDKIEIIVLGGTFLQYEIDYQHEFIKRCFDALNGKDSKNLEEAKKLNEISEHRCVALCIENRPDNCSPSEIRRMLEFGCTRVELGVQMPDDEIYKKTNRGHSVQDVIDSTKRLKDAGFKIGYHIMPGLPYSNREKDLKLFRMIFENENFRPDQLKIYPCQVVDDSPLAKTYKIIKFKPYTEQEAKEIMEEMMRIIPEYCRVMRMMREFPREKLIEGIEKLDLRKDIEDDLRKNKEKIKEIRMREVGFNKNVDVKVKLKTTEYDASGGKEYFLEFVNKKSILFGLLRLRVFKNNAFVRELHVYGKAAIIGEKSDESQQHKGIGKLLMHEAEKIAKENKIKKLKVISGVGVREYYKNLGYNLEKNYMVKEI